MAVTVDSYSETNQSNQVGVTSAFSHDEVGQSFAVGGTEYIFDSCQFYLKNNDGGSGGAVGWMAAKLYAHDGGSYGGTGLPTGNAIGTSGMVHTSSLSTSVFNLITFTFSGADRIELEINTNYFIVLNFFSGTSNSLNFVAMGNDSTSSSHAGLIAGRNAGGAWSIVSAGQDLCFYVFGAAFQQFRAPQPQFLSM